jgi:uncharacterized protein
VFEWDIQNAIANYDKHKISFEEAATAFSDSNGLDGEDADHSQVSIDVSGSRRR